MRLVYKDCKNCKGTGEFLGYECKICRSAGKIAVMISDEKENQEEEKVFNQLTD